MYFMLHNRGEMCFTITRNGETVITITNSVSPALLVLGITNRQQWNEHISSHNVRKRQSQLNEVDEMSPWMVWTKCQTIESQSSLVGWRRHIQNLDQKRRWRDVIIKDLIAALKHQC